MMIINEIIKVAILSSKLTLPEMMMRIIIKIIKKAFSPPRLLYLR